MSEQRSKADRLNCSTLRLVTYDKKCVLYETLAVQKDSFPQTERLYRLLDADDLILTTGEGEDEYIYY